VNCQQKFVRHLRKFRAFSAITTASISRVAMPQAFAFRALGAESRSGRDARGPSIKLTDLMGH
jgi:hypothetical protein